ncbi:MAG: haloacid dehalogenase-like hydrolase [Planctomycetaceae bacterium]|nr:haloacid dehalogenase-like hydrolase [Planctomycetaceae bacterium]
MIFLLVGTTAFSVHAQSDVPLPSWNDSASKAAIVDFVTRVTSPGSPDFVPVPERIAVFDNDGCLWCEAPLPLQVEYVLAELKRRAPQEPKLAKNEMVQAALKGDFEQLLAGDHHDGLMEIIALTHSGMTTSEFDQQVRDWKDSFHHRRFGHDLKGMTYQPMLEVLAYLRENDFKTFIVSGGGADFMRVVSEELYGIPPEQVVGSTSRTKYELRDGKPVLIKTMDYLFVDDKAGKPVGIHQFIGRRPIACFGNSDGDQAMLEYTTIENPHPSLGVIVHHTDATREFAYDKKPPSSGKLVSALKAAPERGWVVVDMLKDWKQVLVGESD